MPSPFPGMDPYLEGNLWSTLHYHLPAEMVNQLAPKLKPKYLAFGNEYYLPDTLLRHVRLEIRDRERRRLVTAIELLSRTNKRGGLGRRQYMRNRLLRSTAHLVEIDLLHGGRRLPMQSPLPPKPYFIFVGRAELRPETDIWPFALSDPIPPIPIPLLPGDEDVSLDLQSAFSRVYDQLGYELAIDYSKPPPVPLPPKEQAWTKRLLKNYLKKA